MCVCYPTLNRLAILCIPREAQFFAYVCFTIFVQVISDPLAEHDPYSYLFKN